MSKKRVLFCGTPKIAAECLITLLNLNDLEVVGVVSQPDRVNSRNKSVNFSEVKQVCLDNDLNLFQFENINNHIQEIKDLNLDLIITCAFGQFISQNILDIPKYKCINIHTSLLPKLRGGAPIHWAIINGYKNTGITIMYMIKKMDAGNIIFQESIDINDEDTYDSLYIKLTNLATEMIKKYIYKIFDLNLKSYIQDESQVTFGLNITKEQEVVDFNDYAINIKNKIRGLYSKPSAKFIFNNEKYKIADCKILNNKSNLVPGTIVDINNSLIISTLDYDISINKIQAPNKNWLEWKQFKNGQSIFKTGNILK